MDEIVLRVLEVRFVCFKVSRVIQHLAGLLAVSPGKESPVTKSDLPIQVFS